MLKALPLRGNSMRNGLDSWLLRGIFLGFFLSSCQTPFTLHKHPEGVFWIPNSNPAQDQWIRVTLDQVSFSPFQTPHVQVYEIAGIHTDGKPRPRPLMLKFFQAPDGSFVPMDVTTSQAFALGYFFKKIYQADQAAGWVASIPWPRRVFLNVPVVQSEGNNARYVAPWDAYIIEPYRLKSWPLSHNLGVLAHEHFHAIFFHQAISRLPEPWQSWALKTPSGPEAPSKHIETHYGLRVWNEALADFWAILVSQRRSFVVDSLPQLPQRDYQQVKPVMLPRKSDFQNWLLSLSRDPDRLGLTYQVATAITHKLLYHWQNTLETRPQPEVLALAASRIQSFFQFMTRKLESQESWEWDDFLALLQPNSL